MVTTTLHIALLLLSAMVVKSVSASIPRNNELILPEEDVDYDYDSQQLLVDNNNNNNNIDEIIINGDDDEEEKQLTGRKQNPQLRELHDSGNNNNNIGHILQEAIQDECWFQQQPQQEVVTGDDDDDDDFYSEEDSSYNSNSNSKVRGTNTLYCVDTSILEDALYLPCTSLIIILKLVKKPIAHTL